jgi:hypothetical protein
MIIRKILQTIGALLFICGIASLGCICGADHLPILQIVTQILGSILIMIFGYGMFRICE